MTDRPKTTLRDCIYGLAVGDALGVPYEFRPRGTFECADMIGYGTHGQPDGLLTPSGVRLCLIFVAFLLGGRAARLPPCNHAAKSDGQQPKRAVHRRVKRLPVFGRQRHRLMQHRFESLQAFFAITGIHGIIFNSICGSFRADSTLRRAVATAAFNVWRCRSHASKNAAAAASMTVVEI